ncbi:unnamed protein product [Sphenostylis stenocarpa]|uniref:Uncharacterized protein n=1 Tax=Sphenostylis stenocarpa TaxID=92480 RepID=A0AA86VRC7_9FABA|nr:unnamed protein product [Sphenostylis stenocarpa]
MRLSFVIYLLLLSLFLTNARGIRLGKESFAAKQHKQHDQESNLLRRINSAANKEAILCKDEQYCAGTLKKRASRVPRKPNKLLPRIHEDYRNIETRKSVTSSTSTTQDISKNVKNGGNEARSPEIIVNKQRELSHEHYLDLVDIAGMDYSSAKKNPPIHN